MYHNVKHVFRCVWDRDFPDDAHEEILISISVTHWVTFGCILIARLRAMKARRHISRERVGAVWVRTESLHVITTSKCEETGRSTHRTESGWNKEQSARIRCQTAETSQAPTRKTSAPHFLLILTKPLSLQSPSSSSISPFLSLYTCRKLPRTLSGMLWGLIAKVWRGVAALFAFLSLLQLQEHLREERFGSLSYFKSTACHIWKV